MFVEKGQAPPEERVEAAKPRLLVVDDEAAVARYVARALKKEWDATLADDGTSALALFEAGERFDAVLCDVMMPQMNGMELYGVLRARHPEMLPRFLFMTGGVFTVEAASFLESLPRRPLDKPLERERLRAALAEILVVARS